MSESIDSKEILVVKREVILQTPPQPALNAVITEVEENIFWTNLPRDGRQLLVLFENQNVKMGVSLQRGFYMAETKVMAIGKEKNKFYGLAIPDQFVIAQERQFVRVDYPTNVLFKAGDLAANSTLVNFSAGGVMVYLVKDLEKIIESGKEIDLHLNIDKNAFEVRVKPAWRKTYDNILFAGFEFVDIPVNLQENLDKLAIALS